MKKAFSLAELLLVLAIISMVVGTMKVHVQHKRIQAEAKNIVEVVNIYKLAISMYHFNNNGYFPDNWWCHLEDVPQLKPYCPPGFDTLSSIHSKKCTDIKCCSDFGSVIRVSFELNDNYANLLRSEVKKQLEEISVPDTVWEYVSEYCNEVNIDMMWGNV